MNLVDPSGLKCGWWGSFISIDGGPWLFIPGTAIFFGSCADNDKAPRPAGGSGGGESPKCTAAKKAAARLAQALQQISDGLGDIALAGGIGTVLGGVGEIPSVGGDTPYTLTAAGITAAAGDASLVTGAAAAIFSSYANGNPQALAQFDVENLINIATRLQSLPYLKSKAKVLGDLAQQAVSLIAQAQQGGGCQ